MGSLRVQVAHLRHWLQAASARPLVCFLRGLGYLVLGRFSKFLGLFPRSFQPSLFFNHQPFSLGFLDGFLERRIPGKNGEATLRKVGLPFFGVGKYLFVSCFSGKPSPTCRRGISKTDTQWTPFGWSGSRRRKGQRGFSRLSRRKRVDGHTQNVHVFAKHMVNELTDSGIKRASESHGKDRLLGDPILISGFGTIVTKFANNLAAPVENYISSFAWDSHGDLCFRW